MKPRRISNDKNDGQHYGRKVQRIRAILGLKQSALADLAGLQQQYISRIERRAWLSEDLLIRLASAMKVSVEFIRQFDEARPFSSKNRQSAILPADSISLHLQLAALIEVLEIFMNMENKKIVALSGTFNELIELHQRLK